MCTYRKLPESFTTDVDDGPIDFSLVSEERKHGGRHARAREQDREEASETRDVVELRE